jgi:hypothetical protein
MGDQRAARRDARLVTDRFHGWESWRRLAVDHVAATLGDDVASVGAVLDEWSPDVVVTSTWAAASRVAAELRSIPHFALSLYPQIRVLEEASGSRFARPYTDAVRTMLADRGADGGALAALAWGATDHGVFLHDPLIRSVVPDPVASRLVGFPYWDAFPVHARDQEQAHDWLSSRPRPVVLLTLGSFVRRLPVVDTVRAALTDVGVDVLVVNAGKRLRDETTLCVGFVSLSTIAPSCRAVVHHGGIGTSYGALRAGAPSVIVPQAFDQDFNATWVERFGIGRRANLHNVGDVLRDVLADDEMAEVVPRVASTLVPVAAERISAAIRSAL